MSRALAHRVAASMVVALCVALPAAAHAQSLRTREAFDALAELRVEEADAIVETLDESALSLELRGMVRFHQGRYEEALTAMDASLEMSPAQPGSTRVEMRDLIRSTRDATQGYIEVRSDDGRFIIRHPPGREATLIPYAMEALQRTDEALQEELGVRVPGPIRLEIYPSASVLAAVSSLTVENIETSGTIALCKWDRLMVTSPRALLRGYPWMDTIAHEFTHLVLARGSRDHAPVWVQEGIAKFLERRWRQAEVPLEQSPMLQMMLREAAQNDTLLPFERLHPSIALLPSQEQAALAFAQVSSFVSLYYQTFGRGALQNVVQRLATGEDAQDAFGNAAQRSFEQLESTWRRSLDRLNASDAPDFRGLRFHGDESDEVGEQARRHLRLGDMLWTRERYGAAARQYERGLRTAPGDPVLAARLARAALAGRRNGVDAQEGAALAIATLQPIAADHPDYAPLRAYLGSAYRVAGQVDNAQREARAALALNPFDPRPHCDLAEIGEEAIRERERNACAALGGEQP